MQLSQNWQLIPVTLLLGGQEQRMVWGLLSYPCTNVGFMTALGPSSSCVPWRISDSHLLVCDQVGPGFESYKHSNKPWSHCIHDVQKIGPKTGNPWNVYCRSVYQYSTVCKSRRGCGVRTKMLFLDVIAIKIHS